MKNKAFKLAKWMGMIPDIRPYQEKAVGHSVSLRIRSTITREGVRYSQIPQDDDSNDGFDEYFQKEAMAVVRQMLIGFLILALTINAVLLIIIL